MSQTTIQIESPLTTDAETLIAGSEQALRAVYTEDECFTFTAAELDQPEVDFLVARRVGAAVGCVAMVKCNGYAEVKRLYVSADARGTGLAVKLMAALEAKTHAEGLQIVRLETGEKLAAAVALYKRMGYVVCGPFGDYQEHPASLFMEKVL